MAQQQQQQLLRLMWLICPKRAPLLLMAQQQQQQLMRLMVLMRLKRAPLLLMAQQQLQQLMRLMLLIRSRSRHHSRRMGQGACRKRGGANSIGAPMDAGGGMFATMLIPLVSFVVLILTHGLLGTYSNGGVLPRAGIERRCCGCSDKSNNRR